MATDKEKRNSNPSDVRVKGPADIAHLMTLDERVDAMVENRNEIVIHNIEYILQQRNITQAQMCSRDLEDTPQPSQIAAYKRKGRDIPFRTIARIAVAYGYTPEQLCGQLLDQTKGRGYAIDKLPPRPNDEYLKYIGTYHMAYFGTDAKLGGNKRTTARSLAYGVLTIYLGNAVDGVPTLRVAAFGNCTEQERDSLVRCIANAEAQGSSRGIWSCYEKAAYVKDENGEKPRQKCFYEGEMTLTERVAEITMRQVKGSDVVHIELHNRAANSSEGSRYKGGLATMMSTSRGAEHMPCIQAVILSKRGFENIAKEELANMLFLEPPKVDLREETKAIISYMKALFPSEDSDNPISHLGESDKAFILESYIEKKLTEVIKRNVLGYYKVSTEMDSEIYKTVCR